MAASASRGRRRDRTLNFWPAYVDALSTLLLAIVFLMSVFALSQFFLARDIAGRDAVLERLNEQISELTDLLALERSGRKGAEENLASLQSTLAGAEQDLEAPGADATCGGPDA